LGTLVTDPDSIALGTLQMKNKAMIVVQGHYNPSGKLRAKDENSRWE